MGAPLAIRTDLEAAELRRLARRERDGRVAARLIALANALDGMSRKAAARSAGMDRQTLRDWVIRFNAEGVEGLRDQPRSGRRPWMTGGQQAALRAIVLRACCAARTRSATGCRPGASSTCAASPKSASASSAARAACGAWSRRSTSPGRRPGPATPRWTRPRRSGSKRGSRRRAGRGGQAPPRGGGAALVPGRGQCRPEGPRRPGLVRARPPPRGHGGPPPRLRLDLRRCPPRHRGDLRAGHVRGQRGRHAGPPRPLRRDPAGARACRPAARRRGLAHRRRHHRPGQRQPGLPAARPTRRN